MIHVPENRQKEPPITTTNLRRVRESRGLTLRELADKLRCTYQAPHSWETRQNKPTLIFREQLERTLGYPADVLLSDDPTLLNENDRQR